MRQFMFHRNKRTALAKSLSLVLAIVFTLSMTGVVHAVSPTAGKTASESITADATADSNVLEAAGAPQEGAAPLEEAPGPEAAETESSADDEDKVGDSSGEEAAVSSAKDKSDDGPKKAKESDKEPPEDSGGYLYVSGNPKDHCEYRIEDPSTGTYTFEVDGEIVHVTLAITDEGDGEVLSWTSDAPVGTVVVKGGPGANIYTYSGATAGIGLHAPLNPSMKWADISWIGFCFEVGQPVEDRGIIKVFKFNDLNHNGELDQGEPGMGGFTFRIVGSDPLIEVTTAEGGWASFPALPYGEYTIKEMPKQGWVATTPSIVEVDLDELEMMLYFGNMAKVEGSISVTKTVDTPSASPGDTVHWTITVENTGDVALTDVIIHDELLDIDNLSIGALGVGQKYSLTRAYIIPMNAVDCITNVVHVTGHVAGGGTVTGTDEATVCIVPAEDMVTKSFSFETSATLVPSPSSIEAHYTVGGEDYIVVLTNQGGGIWTSGGIEVAEGTVITAWSIHAVVGGQLWPVALYSDSTPETIHEDTVNTAVYTPGSISGVKELDLNRDGEADPTPEGGLTGWTFTLNGNLAMAVTNDQGLFTFTGLLPGEFTVGESMTMDQEMLFDLISPVGGTLDVTVTGGPVVLLTPFLNQAKAEQDISITKDANVTQVEAGGTITYTVTVKNIGDEPIGSYTLVDDFDETLVTVSDAGGGAVVNGTITWNVLTPLGVGDSDTFTYTVTVDADVTDATNIVNTATVVEFEKSATETVTVENQPKMVSKSFRLETSAVLEPAPDSIEAHYTIGVQEHVVTLVNQGGGIWTSADIELAEGTVITAWSIHAVVDGALWPVALFSDSTPEAIDEDMVNTAVFTPGSISGLKKLDLDRDGVADDAPSSLLTGWTFTLNGTVSTATNASGAFTFTGLLPGNYTVAESMSADLDLLFNLLSPATGAQTVVVTAGSSIVLPEHFVNQAEAPSISIEKSVDPTEALPGDIVEYTFTVTNTGRWTLDPVTLSDTMLPEVDTTTVPVLEPGDSFTFTVNHTVPADEEPGAMNNIVTALGTTPWGEQVSDTDNAVLIVGQLLPGTDAQVEKTADVSAVQAGDIVEYTVVVKNTGDATIQSYTLVDDYPENLVTIEFADGGTVADGKIVWVGSGLAGGATDTYTYSVRVKDGVADGTLINNTARLVGLAETALAVVTVDNPFLPFTPTGGTGAVTTESPFLPYTGGYALALLLSLAAAAATGGALRRYSQKR